MEAKLKEILKELEATNPALKFELTLKPTCGKWSGWINLVHEGKKYIMYSTAALCGDVIFCGTPNGAGSDAYPIDNL